MYYFINVYQNSILAHLTRSNWEGFFKKCCGMAVKRLGMFGVSVRKMKALSV